MYRRDAPAVKTNGVGVHSSPPVGATDAWGSCHEYFRLAAEGSDAEVSGHNANNEATTRRRLVTPE